MKRLLLGLMVIGSLVIPPATIASPGTANGFTGDYTAIDCATWWQENPDGSHDVNCDIWGDNSTMTLTIGRGSRPRVVFVDYYATVCVDEGLPRVYTGVGSGVFDDPGNLTVTLSAARCGSVPFGAGVSFGLYGPEPTLWNDPDGDGWGTVWYPVE